MKTNSKTNKKNVTKVVKNNIAIVGCEGRANEVRAILTKLGMKNSRNLTFNSSAWFYYVDNGIVKCSASGGIPGYETMSIDTYYKKFKTSKAIILKRYGK